MDQLRVALKLVQRYHFWALSVIVAAIAIGCWYSAAGALAVKFQANRATIEGEFKNQEGLARQPFHANEDINQRQEDQIKKQAGSVRQTWEMLYKRQRDVVLQWPQELDETFRKGVEPLKFEEEIGVPLRDQYSHYIKNYFRKLPEVVGARVAEGDRAAMRDGVVYGPTALGRPSDQEADDTYLVVWRDQDHVRQELDWPNRPTSLEIWVTQENLWVYRTLLQIIADTNEGADRRSNAAVRVIISLEVGQAAGQASASSGRLEGPQADASGPRIVGGGELGGLESGPMPIPSSGAGSVPSRMAGPMGEAGGDERARLLSNRYLDNNGQPIVISGASAGPNEFGVEFKRLPVLMVLEMDERAIPRLIANCTNQPLQVEVQQVRINPSDARGGSRRSSFESRSAGIETFDSQPHVATVVIQGIIYIINQPDTSTLQIAGM